MRVICRTSLLVVLLAGPLLLCQGSRRAVFCAGGPRDATARLPGAQQFYTRVLGHWVGTAVSRLNGKEPATTYFHLVITHGDGDTFREEYTFYRIHPRTDVLEWSGIQVVLSTIGSDGVVHQSCRGNGTVLIDYEPKNQSFEASGEARLTGPDHLEAEAKGKIAVDSLPFHLGKNGKIQKAAATWSLEEDRLIGQTCVETSFRALLFAKRYRYETQFRAQRGADVQAVAGRAPISYTAVR